MSELNEKINSMISPLDSCQALGVITAILGVFALFVLIYTYHPVYSWPGGILALIPLPAGIISIIIGYIVGNWLGYKSKMTSRTITPQGEYATFERTTNPKPEHFGDREKIRKTAKRIIIMGIIAIPGSFVIGGLWLLIAGIRVYMVAKP
jgi:hypothetical protein